MISKLKIRVHLAVAFEIILLRKLSI